jgi:hypothetical protein
MPTAEEKELMRSRAEGQSMRRLRPLMEMITTLNKIIRECNQQCAAAEAAGDHDEVQRIVTRQAAACNDHAGVQAQIAEVRDDLARECDRIASL